MAQILVPLDLLPRSEGILSAVEAHARAHDGEVLLLHVLSATPLARLARLLPVSRPDGSEEAAALLEVAADRLRAAGVPTRTLVCTGAVAETIARVARREDVDLILLERGAGRWFPGAAVGAKTMAILRRALVPVLLVRPVPVTAANTPVRSFATDAAHLGLLAPRILGRRTVAVAQIVGSVGRADELNARFRLRLRRRADDERYAQVLRLSAGEGESDINPVELYRLGHAYYVVDGHRRVAAAKALGHDEIAANVTEYSLLGRRPAWERSTARQGHACVTCGC